MHIRCSIFFAADLNSRAEMINIFRKKCCRSVRFCRRQFLGQDSDSFIVRMAVTFRGPLVSVQMADEVLIKWMAFQESDWVFVNMWIYSKLIPIRSLVGSWNSFYWQKTREDRDLGKQEGREKERRERGTYRRDNGRQGQKHGLELECGRRGRDTGSDERSDAVLTLLSSHGKVRTAVQRFCFYL